MTQAEKVENTINLLARLDGWLRINRPEYYAKLLPGLSQAEVDNFEQKLGVTLPIEFKLFYQWKNGQDSYDNFIANFGLLKLKEAVALRSFMNEMLVAGEFENRPNWWRTNWLSFTENGGGDSWCIDLEGTFNGTTGQIITFWHDWERRDILCTSFYSWLETVVLAFENGKHWLNEETEAEDEYEAFWDFWSERNPGYPIRNEAG
jgi:cell wall assembly regulator SMI1